MRVDDEHPNIPPSDEGDADSLEEYELKRD